MSNEKGFTLVEILIVLVIIGILASVALPSYFTMIQQGAAKATQDNLVSVYSAEKNYYLNNGAYCTAACSSLANINTTLSLNLADTNFSYVCAAGGSSYTCTAKNIANNAFTMVLSGPPNQVILPGGTPPLNPTCTDAINPNYCP